MPCRFKADHHMCFFMSGLHLRHPCQSSLKAGDVVFKEKALAKFIAAVVYSPGHMLFFGDVNPYDECLRCDLLQLSLWL